jgi:hypothetical protein
MAEEARAPRVSVVMPLFNAAPYVEKAVRSVLEQTYRDFELIIVDDGSTDGSAETVRAITDPHIRLITKANEGIASALNAGVAAARGEFIARMDADDVAMPERLARQVAYMDAHSELGLLGTWAEIVDADGTRVSAFEHPVTHERIQHDLLFDTPFAHPTMLIRRALLGSVGGYDGDPAIFEDHDLWRRMITRTRGANLPEHLLRYRRLPTSLSHNPERRMDRIAELRRRIVLDWYPTTDPGVAASVGEFALRHGRIPCTHFVPVRNLLSAHARAMLSETTERNAQLRFVRHAMRGYRLIPHRTQLHRIADRALKEMLLLWSDLVG